MVITPYAHTNFYYSENALSAITSSSEHLNGHQIAARAATQAGLVYRVMGLVCGGPHIGTQGNDPLLLPLFRGGDRAKYRSYSGWCLHSIQSATSLNMNECFLFVDLMSFRGYPLSIKGVVLFNVIYLMIHFHLFESFNGCLVTQKHKSMRFAGM